jgi:ABC-type branched-subunit amino acid transport system ATPase component
VLNRSAAVADEALEHMRLTRFANVAAAMPRTAISVCSKSRWRSLKPRLLMLDEPTKGLSRGDRTRGANSQGMLSVGISCWSSTTEVVFKLADDITVLHRGRVIADGPPAAVRPMRRCAAPISEGPVMLRIDGLHTYYGHGPSSGRGPGGSAEIFCGRARPQRHR